MTSTLPGTRYDSYNREERALCSHLFRLLHERLADGPDGSVLSRFLRLLSQKGIEFKNHGSLADLASLSFTNVAIYSEVALIRDAYENVKLNPVPFMDTLVELIKKQLGVADCRTYSELPEDLRNPKKTHPRQIAWKASTLLGERFRDDEHQVYGTLQGMFNAKPDMAITVDGCLIVFEAKLTEPFDKSQLRRTLAIAEVWASDLLCSALGFDSTPSYALATIGLSKRHPSISWQEVYDLARDYYPDFDRTLIALGSALRYD